ncbi:YoaK family protein [Flavicella sediminum]|uniref:YoaK family protein n=1 Tax=Flavicella sediminum TaxID=2585141 RepID=UPI0011219314|nr:YoaK family protein [Flavicella sediminum]
MFRHQGRSRTLKHNLRIATILSFVAGIVNVTGFLSFKQLTTNVTGHFALFINDLATFQFWKGTIYFLYIFSFLFGSFLSSFLIEQFKENKKLNVFLLPTLIESLILIIIALLSNLIEMKYSDFIVCALLFAMGLQNSLVTKISNAVVRTTHLTGLFTDLGIDISQLFFPKSHPNKAKLKANIKLRIYIIIFFFAGGLTGGFFYSRLDLKLNTLIFAAFILLISLFYDDFRYKLIKTKRKYKQRKKVKHATK